MNLKILKITISLLLISQLSMGQEGWVNLNLGSNSRIDDLYFLNADTGWVAGTTAIRKTTNGGQTWTTQYNSPSTYLRS
ncbi:MAG: hypothetical protein IT258_18675, partial [Saprospiraceae bacterium]|nr:hypothetical protein [Saprospiraceae bacterium]